MSSIPAVIFMRRTSLQRRTGEGRDVTTNIHSKQSCLLETWVWTCMKHLFASYGLVMYLIWPTQVENMPFRGIVSNIGEIMSYFLPLRFSENSDCQKKNRILWIEL